MHYVRSLRKVKVKTLPNHGGISLSVLFTITTDLGDSFLYPEDGPFELVVAALPAEVGLNVVDNAQMSKLPTCRCKWETGMRVLEAEVRLGSEWERASDVSCTVVIQPVQQLPTTSQQKEMPLGSLLVQDILPWRIHQSGKPRMGIVMPAALQIEKGTCAEVAYRTMDLGLRLDGGNPLGLVIEEDIGESIARHIWDAGVLTSAYLADANTILQDVTMLIPIHDGSVNILELGSGVGILGLTVASVLIEAARVQKQTLTKSTVLLTDVEEAKECANRNIIRAKTHLAQRYPALELPKIEYENLDWDEGREGRLGPMASAIPWDIVVLSDCTYNVDSLPALVGTLSALHRAKRRLCGDGVDKHVTSSVLLATKPRHSSEQALFGLLDAESWRYRVLKEIPLPKIGEEDEVVQIFMLEKSG